MQVHFISIKINQLIHLKSYFVNIYVWCITAKVHGLLMLSNALNHVKSLNNNNLYLYCKVLPFKRNNPISMGERLNHNPLHPPAPHKVEDIQNSNSQCSPPFTILIALHNTIT